MCRLCMPATKKKTKLNTLRHVIYCSTGNLIYSNSAVAAGPFISFSSIEQIDGKIFKNIHVGVWTSTWKGDVVRQISVKHAGIKVHVKVHVSKLNSTTPSYGFYIWSDTRRREPCWWHHTRSQNEVTILENRPGVMGSALEFWRLFSENDVYNDNILSFRK